MYELIEDVLVVEVHFVVDGVVDGIVVRGLVLDVASVLELVLLLHSVVLRLDDLLLERSLQLLSLLPLGFVLLQQLYLQQVAASLNIKPFTLSVFFLLLFGFIDVLQVALCGIISELIGVFIKLHSLNCTSLKEDCLLRILSCLLSLLRSSSFYVILLISFCDCLRFIYYCKCCLYSSLIDLCLSS